MRKTGGARRKEIHLRVKEYEVQSVPPNQQVPLKYRNTAQVPRVTEAIIENNNCISAVLRGLDIAQRLTPVQYCPQSLSCTNYCRNQAFAAMRILGASIYARPTICAVKLTAMNPGL
jgi:hypothetical protein